MPHFFPGPLYHFCCRRCAHRFTRSIKLGLLCPKCFSLRVVHDWRVLK